jgi:hypothetical protein
MSRCHGEIVNPPRNRKGGHWKPFAYRSSLIAESAPGTRHPEEPDVGPQVRFCGRRPGVTRGAYPTPASRRGTLRENAEGDGRLERGLAGSASTADDPGAPS